MTTEATDWQARAESAESENRALREILRDADEYLADEPAPTEGGSSYVPELRARIRAALKED